MAKRRKKGSSHTPKAEDRHWYGKRQTARATKAATRTGSVTTGPRRESSAAGDRPQRRPAPEGPEIVTGRNPVVEALRAGIPASTLYVMTGASDDRIRESIKLATDAGVALLEAGKAELDRMTDRAVHQGIALQVPEYDYAHPDDLLQLSTKPLIVALDGVTDPRNLGAIVRACDGAGADGLVLPRHGSAGVTSIVAKASAGAVEHVRIAMTTNLAELLRRTKRPDLWSYAAEAEGGAAPWEIDMTGGTILVLGSEGSGIRPLVRKLCDAAVSIPQAGRVASLNVAVAAGTLLYEAARQRAVASR
jgi:23S rRNA (guanosine2251-2'-O)-methyltransferase